MTDAKTTLEQEKTTVSGAANRCLESFQKCFSQASSINPRELSLIEDQMARFSTWMSDIGLFAPGASSMGHQLQYVPEMRSIAVGLLESLDYHIENCSDVLLCFRFSHSENQEANTLTTRLGMLQQFLSDIAIEITHLNKMANIIPRTNKEIYMKDFLIKDEDENVIEPLLLAHYEHHIGNLFPEVNTTIQHRLAKAMMFRRKQILYKRFCYRGDNLKDRTSPQVESPTTLDYYKFKMPVSSLPLASATIPTAFDNHEALSFPSALGLQTKLRYEQVRADQVASHRAMLDELDELLPAMDSTLNPVLAQRNSQERILIQEQLRSALDSKIQSIGEVICPYCLFSLPLEEVFNEQKWQAHVKNDLDPYVCLIEECNQPDELYQHREDWISHMHQHSRYWRCSFHGELGLFLTGEEYMQHMREIHDPKLSDSKLRALAKRNARSMPKLFSSCPLCGNDEFVTGSRLMDHIAGHLKSLALKSLPDYKEDISDFGDEGGSSSDSYLRRMSIDGMLDDENIRGLRSTGTEVFEAMAPNLQRDTNHHAKSSNSRQNASRRSSADIHHLSTKVYPSDNEPDNGFIRSNGHISIFPVPFYNILEHFLSLIPRWDQGYQRPLPGFEEPESPSESENRMGRLLLGFEKKFGGQQKTQLQHASYKGR